MKILRAVAPGLLVGAALGAAEMCLRMRGSLDEASVARRAGSLVLYAAVLYSFVFALAGAVSAPLLRQYGDTPARRRIRSLGWIAFGVTTALLVAWMGDVLWQSTLAVRAGSLGLALGLGIGAGWLASGLARRLIGDRAIPPRSAASRLTWSVTALVAIGMGAGWGSWVQSRSAPPPPSRPAPAAAAPDGSRPNILLVVADTLRPDPLGCYGSPKGLTPTIDRLAGSGVLFRNAYAQSSWTLPSVVSMLSSTPPVENGFTDFESVIPSGLRLLPEVLAEAGYQTLGIVGNPLMAGRRGFERGFDLYDVYNQELEGRLALSRSVGGLLRLTGLAETEDRKKIPLPWLEAHPPFFSTRLTFYVHDEELNERRLRYAPPPRRGPRFLYVHYVAPHSPYLAHPYRLLPSQPRFEPGNLEILKSLYDGEVSYMDAILGDLLEELKAEGFLDHAIVAFVSDHGEEFLEHGHWEHGHSLYQEVLRVPVVLAGAGLPKGRRIAGDIQLLDLAPTLVDLAGLPVPEGFRGRSLRPLVAEAGEGVPPGWARPIFADLSSRYLNRGLDFRSAMADGWKLIRRRRWPGGALITEEVYDLRSDPNERSPGPDATALPNGLASALDAYEATARRRGSGEAVTLTDEEKDRLRGLGYLQ